MACQQIELQENTISMSKMSELQKTLFQWLASNMSYREHYFNGFPAN
jgi:hypothetical protein